MKKKKKLNYKKVIIGYLTITVISTVILLLLLPNTPTWNYLWCFGFLTGVALFTCLIEGGDDK